jgi:hypothetical protein
MPLMSKPEPIPVEVIKAAALVGVAELVDDAALVVAAELDVLLVGDTVLMCWRPP